MPLRVLAAFALCLMLLSPASGEVIRWEIVKREPYANGKTLGDRGAYERWTGKVYFAADPKNEFNRQIVDLELAPRNDGGKVEFSADFEMLVPADRSKANGGVFYEVNNRGNKTAPNMFDTGADEFLCRQGFVVLWSGWIAEVQPAPGKLRFTAPVPTQDGRPLRGVVRNEFVLDKPAERASISHRGNQGSYRPTADAIAAATLTRREREADPRQVVPRDQWKFVISEVSTADEAGQLPLVELEVQGGLRPG